VSPSKASDDPRTLGASSVARDSSRVPEDGLPASALPPSAHCPGDPGRTGLDTLSGSRGRSAFQGQDTGEGAPGGAPSTSLDSYPISVFEKCPRKPRVLVSLSTGQLVHVGCRANFCEVCGPRNIRRQAQAVTQRISVVDRTRFCTLTNAPEDWQQRRLKVRNLRRYLSRRGYRWEMFWSCERGSKTGMLHVHGIQYGDFVPQAVLQEVWGQIVDIRGVRSSKVSNYVLKDAARVAGYTLKGDGHAERIALNGGRPAHWTRNFFGTGLHEFYATMTTGDAGPWELSTLASAVATNRTDGRGGDCVDAPAHAEKATLRSLRLKVPTVH